MDFSNLLNHFLVIWFLNCESPEKLAYLTCRQNCHFFSLCIHVNWKNVSKILFPDDLLSFNYMYPYFVKLLNEFAIQPLSTELYSWKWAIFMPPKITFYYFFNEKVCMYCLWLGCICVDLWKIGNSKSWILMCLSFKPV